MTLIEKPSQLPVAIGEALKRAFPLLRVGNHQDFQGASDRTGVLITVERNGPDVRSFEGRKAHALAVSLRVTVASGATAFDACDLASQLMDLALDNRWGLPPDQCDLPTAIVAAPTVLTGNETDYDSWTVSFTQNLYFGPSLLEDPTGTPLFACTWEVSDIDDPDQYRPLQE
ncbi:hypothetical protein A7317_05720 [Pseudomonas fluorescens]|jgi:hypothetical protein|uniref:Phage protein n=2 Tax=Pseudomonas TaxID=286 RepID=A0A5M8FWS5_PSEVE|nr:MULTISPECIES: hypothetical protein [Pseudomonas]BDD44406.1 hypothetical protein 3 [bacterium]BDD46815.1 hypothetical protein 2 [Saccharospirillaceae bacterium]DAH53439.1 MAG TPA: tail completion protein [Caudoviricetes sp.]AHC33952.1 hypothetical protein U771_07025 [Pseudomonas sp. TKP]AOE66506.1 hypothetical protein A7317_05720 [Pseudomonas fluorescens]